MARPRAKSIIVIGKPRIREVKFPKRLFGEAYQSDYLILIRKNLRSKTYLFTLLHELAHLILPDASEKKIKQIESILGNAVWKAGFRRIAK